MKTFGRAFLAILATALLFNSSSAGLLDQTKCTSGSYYSMPGGELKELDDRIVACFNYSQEIETENHNRQARTIDLLEQRISSLETLIFALDDKVAKMKD